MLPLTLNEAQAPGGQSLINGGYRTAAPPTIPVMTVAPMVAPAPAPAPAPAAPMAPPEPTVGETLQGIKSQALTIQDQLNQIKAAEAAAKSKSFQSPTLATNNVQNPLLNPIDERAIQRNQLRLFQNEINATNKVYDQLYNQKVLEGTGRLGTQRAQAARGGLLGSDFGSAQRENVISYNTDITNAVQAERQAKIGAIMGNVRTAVADEIAAKRLARTQDADAYLKYLTSRDETRSKNTQAIAQSFLTQGIDPATLSPDEMKAITGDSGISAADIIMQYQTAKTAQDATTAKSDLETRKTEAEIKKIDADIAKGKLITIGEGTMLYDTETGETFKNPKTYAPGTGSGSSVGLSTTGKRDLLAGGWSESEIATLEAGVRSDGLQAVIDAEKAAGATPAQIKALQKAYGSDGASTEQFLSKDYFSKIFTTKQLEDAAVEAGFGDMGEGVFKLKDVDTNAYLEYLNGIIESYRQAGYTDQEILKMMQ